MLISNDFEVAEPVETVWRTFQDIPRVASCLPGTALTKDLGDDRYEGRVSVRMGPVSLRFAGTAHITQRDDAAKRIVVEASGAEEKGRGQASMTVTAVLSRVARGTKVSVAQDMQIAGAAAQYGRGMIADVSAVLMRDFAANLERRIHGDAPADETAAPARGFALGLAAMTLALKRVFRRFFAPYQGIPT